MNDIIIYRTIDNNIVKITFNSSSMKSEAIGEATDKDGQFTLHFQAVRKKDKEVVKIENSAMKAVFNYMLTSEFTKMSKKYNIKI